MSEPYQEKKLRKAHPQDQVDAISEDWRKLWERGSMKDETNLDQYVSRYFGQRQNQEIGVVTAAKIYQHLMSNRETSGGVDGWRGKA